MKYYTLITISFLFISCMHSSNSNVETKHESILSLNINSYSGYAFVFFKDNCSNNCFAEHVKLIYVDNADSTDFINDRIDVRSYISKRLAIATLLNYRIDFFKNSRYKYKVEFNTCNIDSSYNYFIKCWVDYSGYEESSKYPGRKLHPQDTCYQTAIIFSENNKSRVRKIIKYRILNIKKH